MLNLLKPPQIQCLSGSVDATEKFQFRRPGIFVAKKGKILCILEEAKVRNYFPSQDKQSLTKVNVGRLNVFRTSTVLQI